MHSRNEKVTSAYKLLWLLSIVVFILWLNEISLRTDISWALLAQEAIACHLIIDQYENARSCSCDPVGAVGVVTFYGLCAIGHILCLANVNARRLRRALLKCSKYSRQYIMPSKKNKVYTHQIRHSTVFLPLRSLLGHSLLNYVENLGYNVL